MFWLCEEITPYNHINSQDMANAWHLKFAPLHIFHDTPRLHVSPSYQTRSPNFYLQLWFTAHPEPVIPYKYLVLPAILWFHENLSTHLSFICLFLLFSVWLSNVITATSLRPQNALTPWKSVESDHFLSLTGNEMVSWCMWSLSILQRRAQGGLWLSVSQMFGIMMSEKLSSKQVKWQ